MKKNISVFIVFLALLIIASPTFAAIAGDEYIGYRHLGVTRGETLPNGAIDLGGGLLSDENYGVSRFVKNGKFMLWFEKIVDRNEEGVPYWEVKDVLTFEKPKKNQQFFFSHSSPCLQRQKFILDLIVLAERAPGRKSYKVINAWRASVKNEKFEKTSINKIVCSLAR
jgi:hypothetical protein